MRERHVILCNNEQRAVGEVVKKTPPVARRGRCRFRPSSSEVAMIAAHEPVCVAPGRVDRCRVWCRCPAQGIHGGKAIAIPFYEPPNSNRRCAAGRRIDMPILRSPGGYDALTIVGEVDKTGL